MGHGSRRVFLYGGAVVAAVVLVAVLIYFTNHNSTGTQGLPDTNILGVKAPAKPTPTPTPTVSVLTPSPTPRTGAASLNLDTCGCPTSGMEPSCNVERHWTANKFWNQSTDQFVITRQGEDRIMVTGVIDLAITNTGLPNTTLTSVVVELEQAASGAGNAPGPSGENFLKIAAAVISASNSQCNNPLSPKAKICSKGSSFTVTGTTGSTVVVYDGNGNSIVGIESVNIGTSQVDDDGDGLINEDSGDGFGQCNTVNNTYGVDDDGDGLIDEDGVCPAVVHFKVVYAFYVSDSNFGLIAGTSTRVNLLATFLSGGDRGGTCTTDTNCDNVIQAAEMNARTVQYRIPFTFPTYCAPRCECITSSVLDFSVIRCSTPGLGTYTLSCPLASRPTTNITSGTTDLGRTCSPNSTTIYEGIDVTCPTSALLDSRVTITDSLTIAESVSPDCFDVFGMPLITGSTVAVAQYFCNATVIGTSPTPVPTPIPTPVSYEPYVPTPGSQCTFTRGAFGQACKKSRDTAFCNQSNYGTVQPGCVIDSCSSLMYPSKFNVTLPGYSTYQITMQPTNNSQMPDFIKLFVTSNVGTPFHFTESRSYTSLAVPGEFATAAHNLAAQLATALFNRDRTLRFGTPEQKDIFHRLYIRNETCHGLAAFGRGRKLSQLINITQCIASLANAQGASIAKGICKTKCAYVEDYVNLCDTIFNTYTIDNNWSSDGLTLFSALNDYMNEYNVDFDMCIVVEDTCFLVGPPTN